MLTQTHAFIVSHLVQVVVDLRACLVQRVHGGAAQLKLAARLQRHALAVLQQPYDVPILYNRLPVEALPNVGQQCCNLLVCQPPSIRDVVP